MTLFGTSGVRGPVGETVTCELALSIGRAVGSGTDRVVVGRDVRESGRMLAAAVTAGLRECGADVVDVGVASTPTIARSVAWCEADAGIAVTASHNPPEDNGLKLWTERGKTYDPAALDAVERRIEAEEYDLVAWDAVGSIERWSGAGDRHVEAITEAVTVAGEPNVVVDLGTGAGGVTVEALRALGCAVTTINAEPDGRFPARPSEPTAEHCETLASVVAATDADLGVAHDGDADRLMAVADDGTFLPGDVLLALFGRDAVRDVSAAVDDPLIAAPVNTSLAVDDALAEHGGAVTRTRVGDGFVADRATDPAVVFGGEPSGAWIWPDATLCPDGPLAACRLAALVAREGPLARLVESVPSYPLYREGVALGTASKVAVMDRIQTAVETGDGPGGDGPDGVVAVDDRDGLRVDLGDAWYLIRPSGTQPLIRVTAEAREDDRAESVFGSARTLVEEAIHAVSG